MNIPRPGSLFEPVNQPPRALEQCLFLIPQYSNSIQTYSALQLPNQTAPTCRMNIWILAIATNKLMKERLNSYLCKYFESILMPDTLPKQDSLQYLRSLEKISMLQS